jgi:NAD(P)H dehydrogenase (quinone)
MTNILIVYYSSYGHIEATAQAQAEGAARVPGARVSVKRVPDGMIIVGLPYSCDGITTMREVTGGTPYGATCVTGSGDELRMPSVLELQMCRFQGEHVARIASRLAFSAAAWP